MTKPCLDCGALTKGSRCATCTARLERITMAADNRDRGRPWRRLRTQAIQRDRGCRRCGASGPGVAYRIHHVTPLAEGGPDTLENVVTLCVDCHRKAHRTRPQDDDPRAAPPVPPSPADRAPPLLY